MPPFWCLLSGALRVRVSPGVVRCPHGTKGKRRFGDPSDATRPALLVQAATGQGRAGGGQTLALTGPNLGEIFVCIRGADNSRWSAAGRPPTGTTSPLRSDLTKPSDAWEAAFELYRVHVIVGAGASEARRSAG